MERKRLVVVVILLSSLLIIPSVFSSGFVDMTGNLFSSGSESSSSTLSTPGLFVDPVKIIDSRLQASNASKFNVTVNSVDVVDLFSWQVNMSWNASILSVNKIYAGEFLMQTPSENKTASYQLGFVINSTDNLEGYTAMGESILGDVDGINGGGELVTVEFLVTGYGCTSLNISLAGSLPTTLLNGTGGDVTPPPENVANGYFRNKFQGDATGDTYVDIADIVKVIYHRSGPPPGPGGYDRNVDINDDDRIDIADIVLVIANRGSSLG